MLLDELEEFKLQEEEKRNQVQCSVLKIMQSRREVFCRNRQLDLDSNLTILANY